MDFLAQLFELGSSYSAINSARSALSAVGLVMDGFAAGAHPLVVRFMKGVYNLNPPQARYADTWDVSVVLNYLKTLSPDSELTLKMLTLKLVMLLALVLASRCHSLHLLTLDDMRKESSKFVLRYSGPLKQSRPGVNVPFVEIKSYAPDRRICSYTVLNMYLLKTKDLRGDIKKLLISYIKSYRPVSSSTIGRWIKSMMCQAGIDCEKYKAHSVRAAATSRAKSSFVPIQDILRTAGWSNVQTFREYYDKSLESNAFSHAILKS